MKKHFKSLVVLLAIALPVLAFGQSGTSLQRITVTSVAIRLDSVKSLADAEMIRQEITRHPEVKDFDIKMGKCNFTIENTNNTLDVIFTDLAQRNQPVRVVSIEPNQTFTRVPEENCMSKNRQADLKEEDYLKQHPELKKEEK